jgi:AcrR family transcriptional regulator
LPGLRESKREERLQRIVDAAVALFTENGFEATTMEGIAEAAKLGTGTLYNYFPSKAELLLGIISLRTPPFAEELERIAGDAETSPRAALRKAIDAYLESFSFYPRLLWRDFAITCLSKGLPLFAMIEEVDAPFIACVEAIAENLVQSSKGSKLLARNMYSVLIHSIMLYLSDESIDENGLRNRIDVQLSALIAQHEGA